jgi:hypothetical protein
MHHMSTATLARLLEIIVKDTLNIERRMTCCHTEYAWLLLYYSEILVFINEAYVAALKGIVALGIGHTDFHARREGIVILGDGLAVNLYASATQGVLYLVLTAWKRSKEILQEGHLLIYIIVLVFSESGIVGHQS